MFFKRIKKKRKRKKQRDTWKLLEVMVIFVTLIVVMELWKLRRDGAFNWNKKEASIPEFKTETELRILKRR